MLLLAMTFVLFAALGWRRAARRGGTRGDRIQYALAHAIPATLAMLAIQTIALRLGLFL
ncbi:MAG: hypothetical protein AAFR79_10245 [Pseudomonadota bacterium]